MLVFSVQLRAVAVAALTSMVATAGVTASPPASAPARNRPGALFFLINHMMRGETRARDRDITATSDKRRYGGFDEREPAMAVKRLIDAFSGITAPGVVRMAVVAVLWAGGPLLDLSRAQAASQVTAEAAAAAKVDALFAKWDTTVSPGCAVAIMRDGAIVHQRGYGMADLEHGIPNTPDTVFHIASVSKQFAAAAIVLLAQEGKLSLDDPVRKYVPELPDFGTPLTIRQMVHHTSGLRDQWSMLEFAGWRYSRDLITDDDVMSLVALQRGLNFPPNSKYDYSNTGYTLLAQIVQRVSGQSFREFTTERLFKPLGMRQTYFRDDFTEIIPRIAYGYVPSSGDQGFKTSVTNFNTVGATGLLTTVEDLQRWDENFYQPLVGGAAFVEQMQQQGILSDGEQIDYAFGLLIGRYRGLRTVRHSGSDAGYRSELLRFPEQHFSVACLCNVSVVSPTELTERIADIYLAQALASASDAAPAAVQLSGQELKRGVGSYFDREQGYFYRIVLQDGKLSAVDARGLSVELLPMSASRFHLVNGIHIATLDFSGGDADAFRMVTVTTQWRSKPQAFERVPEYTPSVNQLTAYTGAYRSEELEARYRITLQGGRLLVSALKMKPQPLRVLTRDIFAADFGTVSFIRAAGGRISGFKVDADGFLGVRFDRLAGT